MRTDGDATSAILTKADELEMKVYLGLNNPELTANMLSRGVIDQISQRSEPITRLGPTRPRGLVGKSRLFHLRSCRATSRALPGTDDGPDVGTATTLLRSC